VCVRESERERERETYKRLNIFHKRVILSNYPNFINLPSSSFRFC